MEATRLRQEISEARKKTDSRGTKLTSLREVGDEILAMKRYITMLLMSATNAREYRLTKDSLTCRREVEMELSKKREKTLDRNFASVN